METYRKFIWLHLSVLLRFIIPFGAILGPLLVSYRKSDPQLKKSAANIINFQIIWYIFVLVLIIIFWFRQLPKLLNSEEFHADFLIGIAIGVLIVNVLYPIVVSVMIGVTKKVRLYYPTLIRFMK